MADPNTLVIEIGPRLQSALVAVGGLPATWFVAKWIFGFLGGGETVRLAVALETDEIHVELTAQHEVNADLSTDRSPDSDQAPGRSAPLASK